MDRHGRILFCIPFGLLVRALFLSARVSVRALLQFCIGAATRIYQYHLFHFAFMFGLCKVVIIRL